MIQLPLVSAGKITVTRMASSNGRPKPLRKQWSNEDMMVAMDAVEKGKLSISVAASRFNVPRKTLDDSVKGRVRHGTSPGPSTVRTA